MIALVVAALTQDWVYHEDISDPKGFDSVTLINSSSIGILPVVVGNVPNCTPPVVIGLI